MKDNLKIFSIFLIGAITTIQGCYIEDNINTRCNSDCTIVQGRFTTEDGTVGIKNVGLKLDWYVQPTPGGLFGGRERKIATAKTDKEGNYKIMFYAKDEELIEGAFAIEFDVPDNSYITRPDYSYFQFSGIDKRDTVVTRNYHIPKKGGTITIRITNPQDITGDDELRCDASYKFDDLTHDIEFYAGGVSSTSFGYIEATFNTAANQYTYLRISKKDNGEYFNSLDSIVVPMHETKVYEIAF